MPIFILLQETSAAPFQGSIFSLLAQTSGIALFILVLLLVFVPISLLPLWFNAQDCDSLVQMHE